MKRGRIDLAEILGLSSVYFPEVSHDGRRLAFYWDRSGQMELYVVELPDGEPRQVSHGNVPRSLRAGFVWCRDNRSVIFAKDDGGNEQHDLYRLDLETGEDTRLTETPTAQELPCEVSPDGRTLAFRSNRDGQMNLYRLSLESGEVVALTHHASPVYVDGKWSPDGRSIVYGTNETDDLKNMDIYVVDADGGAPRRVYRSRIGARDVVCNWMPDGRRLAITSDESGVDRPGILDLDTGEVRWLGTAGVEETAVEVSRNGEWLGVLRNQDATITPVLYRTDRGEARTFSDEKGVAFWLRFALDGRAVIYAWSTSTRHRELLLVDPESEAVRRLTPVDYGSIASGDLVDSQYVAYPSTGGRTIHAILYAPRGTAPGEKLPALVHVHGGPTGQFSRGFDPFTQYLVDQGFVVLQPNVRGSTGYGVEFRDCNLKDWGGGDLDDVAAGAEYLKSLAYVDPERIGLWGGSYGGYMTFIGTVKRPELWKAGVAWIGISDLHRLYEKSMEHFKYILRQQMGDPVADADLWRDRSAIHFMDELRAKLLIMHGVNDPRCPIEQARIVRDRLLELGRIEGEDFEYVEFTGVGHASSDIGEKVASYRIIADFLERSL